MEIAGTSRAAIGRADAVEIGKKVFPAKDRLGKKPVALGLHNSLLAAIIDRGVIVKLKED